MLAILLTFLILLATGGSAVQDDACLGATPLSVSRPTGAHAVYFLFVIDNAWPPHKIAQQKALYRMLSCAIPRSPPYRVGAVYAHAPRRPADFVFDDRSLVSADALDSTFDARLDHDSAHSMAARSRCARMHAVVETMRLADFTYDAKVHTHYVFPVDDSEDDFANDCDPAWTFKQSARNILNDPSPNHLYLDVIRIGEAARWTQYGERLQLEDWSERSINQHDVSMLARDFIRAALTGQVFNDVIVFSTQGLVRSERSRDLKSMRTAAPPPTTTTTSTPPPTTTAASSSTSRAATASAAASTRSTAATAAAAAPIGAAGAAAAGPPAVPMARAPRRRGSYRSEEEESEETASKLARPRRNITGAANSSAIEEKREEPPVEEKHVVFGLQTPFSTTTFYLLVVASTAGVCLLVWALCALVFYCCYRDDDVIKKHDAKVAEREEDMMLLSGLNHENDQERPSTIMISDHLRAVKEAAYTEEQLKWSETRGTITVE